LILSICSAAIGLGVVANFLWSLMPSRKSSQ
jgi:hypothetical protein